MIAVSQATPVDVHGEIVYVASTHARRADAERAVDALRELGAFVTSALDVSGMDADEMTDALTSDIGWLLKADLVVMLDDASDLDALVPEAIIAETFGLPIRRLSDVLPVAA